jgi:hypothetical protein
MLGKGAVTMWWSVPRGVQAEWEDWHTHEHMPERLSIPGFLRGSRWVSGNAYFTLYEVDTPATLTGAAYLKRLNNPTPWSRKMMPHHHDIVRSLCTVRASYGGGLGQVLASVRFSRPPRGWRALAARLARLPQRRGLVSAHLLESAKRAPATAEQRMRGGADARADWVVLVGGYDAKAVEQVMRRELARLPGAIAALYRPSFSLVPRDA